MFGVVLSLCRENEAALMQHIDDSLGDGVEPSWARVLELVDTKPPPEASTDRFLQVLIRCKDDQRATAAA